VKSTCRSEPLMLEAAVNCHPWKCPIRRHVSSSKAWHGACAEPVPGQGELGSLLLEPGCLPKCQSEGPPGPHNSGDRKPPVFFPPSGLSQAPQPASLAAFWLADPLRLMGICRLALPGDLARGKTEPCTRAGGPSPPLAFACACAIHLNDGRHL
jgi:hypothetical protein